MKICAPLADLKELPSLLELGVKEFYAGVFSSPEPEPYKTLLSPSRRYGEKAHLKDFSQLEKAASRCRSKGAKLFLTLNERYAPSRIPALLESAREAQKAGADALILGDLSFLLELRQAGIDLPLFMGVGGNIFNPAALSFYQKLGVKRVILPRQLSICEIRHMCRNNPGLELEAFVFRGLCPYLDGFCRFWHGVNQALDKKPLNDLGCGFSYRAQLRGSEKTVKPLRAAYQKTVNRRQSYTGCGLCALWEFSRLGIASLKIVGREIPLKDKIEGVEVVKTALEKLNEPGLTGEEFRAFCRESYRKFYLKPCEAKACYYPELQAGK